RVREQSIGIEGFRIQNQVINEIRNRFGPAPADDVGRNLIGDAEGEDRRMLQAAIDGAPDGVAGLGAGLVRIEEANVLAPGNVHENLQIVMCRKVEEPFGWGMINANQVGAELADLGKVLRRLLGRGEGLAGGVGRKGAIRYALDVEFLLPKPEKFT